MYNLGFDIDLRIDNLGNQLIVDELTQYADDFDYEKYVDLFFVVLMDGSKLLRVVNIFAKYGKREIALPNEVRDELALELAEEIDERIREEM